MAELITVARPYAKAAFSFAKENNALAEWSDMLNFSAAVVADEAVAALLENPQLTTEAQADVFVEVCGDKLNSHGQNFVRLLAENKRLAALPALSGLYETLLAEDQRSEEVVVTSAFALSETESQKLQEALAKKLGKDIKLSSEVDTALIGGVVIRAGDMVIDGSVRGKLAQLSHALN